MARSLRWPARLVSTLCIIWTMFGSLSSSFDFCLCVVLSGSLDVSFSSFSFPYLFSCSHCPYSFFVPSTYYVPSTDAHDSGTRFLLSLRLLFLSLSFLTFPDEILIP
ncbi:hypothetical protein K491DRAFT_347636 [Lophiostoma macrostomum CBS 122681]|uniref:Uncharacterized protein n=1 Tax=Lophiostoma macrostomum CBS 122681 TaxID=1314788 RepID=A0A6A6SLM0_9PLEO|nr:hypothetical protein K491DRAFT_347636 [Lophiostoma macrostomum CBS 122681]